MIDGALAAAPLCFSYDESNELGRGVFGIVYQGTNTATGEGLAIKKVDLTAKGRDITSTLAREKMVCDTLRDVHSPFLMKIYEVFHAPVKSAFALVVMQRVHASSLDDFLTTFQRPARAEIRRIMRQLVVAVRVLHNHRIAHRDIKPANISYDPAAQVAKIIDFGFAVRSTEDSLSLSDHATFLGTPLYMPPECVCAHSHRPFKHDIYTLGAVLYELYACEPMYAKCRTLDGLKNALVHNRCRPHKKMNEQDAALFWALTAPNPDTRPDIHTVCELLGTDMPIMDDVSYYGVDGASKSAVDTWR